MTMSAPISGHENPPSDRASLLHHALQSRLKLRQLVLLQTIGQHQVLSRVAVEMNLSQPAITKALHEIEDIFMAPLFDRTSRGLKPTAAGQAVLHYTSGALADMESTSRALTAIDAGLGGRVRIGITPQVPQALLDTALTHLLGQSPRIAVLAREGTTDELVRALTGRELDCAIGRSFDGESSEIVQEAIYQQEPCLLVSSKSAARLSKGPLDWGKLAALDWILPPPNTPMRRTFNTIFVGAGVQPPLPMVETMSLKSIEAVLRTEPNAVTILARDVAAELAVGGHCAPLHYRLSWDLPPVSFFVSRQMAQHPAVVSLALAIRGTASTLSAADRADYKPLRLRGSAAPAASPP
ncbi:MAG: sporulation protein [Rhizobacter sp.]|nr:sporulation protein [Rhizobacter sp.]